MEKVFKPGGLCFSIPHSYKIVIFFASGRKVVENTKLKITYSFPPYAAAQRLRGLGR